MFRTLSLLAAMALLAVAQPNLAPSETEIQKILAERVDKYRQSVGIVVGVMDAQGRRVTGYGQLNQGDPRPLNGETIFEIGSITKVFTSLVLSDMVQRGEVALTDPVAKYLPDGVRVPQRKGRQITLIDLATHTSGLPPEASNFKPNVSTGWEAGYSLQQLYDFLGTYQLRADIGSHFAYSNLGVSLLGIALARRAGMSYEELVRTRIGEPLTLRSTTVTLTPEMRERFAPGHGSQLGPIPNMDLRVFAGAGALRSTVDDLLTLLSAQLGYTSTPLKGAMQTMLDVDRSMVSGMARMFARGWDVHLGWLSSKEQGTTLIWHNGATLGYRSFIGFNPQTRIGVVVLSNTNHSVDDIGMHLLDARRSLLGDTAFPHAQRMEVPIDERC